MREPFRVEVLDHLLCVGDVRIIAAKTQEGIKTMQKASYFFGSSIGAAPRYTANGNRLSFLLILTGNCCLSDHCWTLRELLTYNAVIASKIP